MLLGSEPVSGNGPSGGGGMVAQEQTGTGGSEAAPIPRACWEMAVAWASLAAAAVVVAAVQEHAAAWDITTLPTVIAVLVVAGVLNGRRGAGAAAAFFYLLLATLSLVGALTGGRRGGDVDPLMAWLFVVACAHGLYRLFDLHRAGWFTPRPQYPYLRGKLPLLAVALVSNAVLWAVLPD